MKYTKVFRDIAVCFLLGCLAGLIGFWPQPVQPSTQAKSTLRTAYFYCQFNYCAPFSVHNAPQAIVKPSPVVSTSLPTQAPQPTPAPRPRTIITANRSLPSAVVAYTAEVAKYNWPISIALGIMACESGGNPAAISNPAINYDHISDYGLMQLHGVAILNPEQNIAYAYTVKYLPHHSFNAWSTYKNGCYKKYLT